MKILVADKISEETINSLKKLGGEVVVDPKVGAENLPGAIKDAEILIVRSTKVTKQTIQAGSSLKLIIRAGAGVNTIDVETASANGVYVSNCPGTNTDAVAELALGFLIAADRRIAQAYGDLRNGKWRKAEYGKSRGLKGRTLGIIGFGNIGKALAKRAAAMEMNIIAWDIVRAEGFNVRFCDTVEDIARQADAISVHLPALPETKHMIGKKLFDLMKPGAILINTSRGEVVDSEALKTAIKEKNLRVCIDVYENEPAGGDDVFADTELAGSLACCTPHIGASTDQAAEAVGAVVVDIVKAYKNTGVPVFSVNKPGKK